MASKNNICGVGVAYDGKVSGIRLLSKPSSNESALIYKYQENQIYSCSWGPSDDGKTMDAPSLLVQRAIVSGIQRGRQGYGSVYIFAAGNGGANGDNCNFDGYANSIYTVTVGAIDREDNHPYYSEPCSAQLVVAYSSGAGDAIHTTEVGSNHCYNGHGGTSAAAPLVSGVVALALSIRPDLTWRDIQYLCIEGAVPILKHSDWQRTKIGKHFSHAFGYGKIDAWRFVETAKNWKSVKPQAWFHSPRLTVQARIPEGAKGVEASFEVTEKMLRDANLERLEHFTITMNIIHTRRGALGVELRSPGGISSYLATERPRDHYKGGYEDWTFMSVAHWGESGIGT